MRDLDVQAGRLSPLLITREDASLNARHRLAYGAIRRWLGQGALQSLVTRFGGDPDLLGVAERSHRSGTLREALENSSPWLGREALSESLLARFERRKSLSDRELLLAAVLLLEEFANDVWNFRTGVPEAVRRLLPRLEILEHAATTGSTPVLARDGDEEAGLGLLSFYLGVDAISAASRKPPSRARFEAALVEAFARMDRNVGPADASSLVSWLSSPAEVGYRERWQGSQFPIDEADADAIRQRAAALDLVEETRPALSRYDHVVILGGGGISPLTRAQYAHELFELHDLEVGDLWLLGSPRRVQESERRAADTYAKSATDEFDLMSGAARAAFALGDAEVEFVCGCHDESDRCPVWLARVEVSATPEEIEATPVWMQHERARRFRADSASRSIGALSASTSNPPDRTNTADTYRMLATVTSLAPGQAMLIVTTQVFVPFQTFDALRMLVVPRGVGIDVVGYGAHRGDRPETPEFLLQELLSAIRSARRLAVELVEHPF